VPIEGGERRRRFSDVRSRVEEVAGGARRGGASQRRRCSGVQRKERPRVGRDGLPRPPSRIEEMNRKAP
jgi:hypothetical protein